MKIWTIEELIDLLVRHLLFSFHLNTQSVSEKEGMNTSEVDRITTEKILCPFFSTIFNTNSENLGD